MEARPTTATMEGSDEQRTRRAGVRAVGPRVIINSAIFPFSDVVYYPRTLGARTSLARFALDPPWAGVAAALLVRAGARSWRRRHRFFEGNRRAIEGLKRRYAGRDVMSDVMSHRWVHSKTMIQDRSLATWLTLAIQGLQRLLQHHAATPSLDAAVPERRPILCRVPESRRILTEPLGGASGFLT
jgi:hypothetical protein